MSQASCNSYETLLDCACANASASSPEGGNPSASRFSDSSDETTPEREVMQMGHYADSSGGVQSERNPARTGRLENEKGRGSNENDVNARIDELLSEIERLNQMPQAVSEASGPMSPKRHALAASGHRDEPDSALLWPVEEPLSRTTEVTDMLTPGQSDGQPQTGFGIGQAVKSLRGITGRLFGRNDSQAPDQSQRNDVCDALSFENVFGTGSAGTVTGGRANLAVTGGVTMPLSNPACFENMNNFGSMGTMTGSRANLAVTGGVTLSSACMKGIGSDGTLTGSRANLTVTGGVTMPINNPVGFENRGNRWRGPLSGTNRGVTDMSTHTGAGANTNLLDLISFENEMASNVTLNDEVPHHENNEYMFALEYGCRGCLVLERKNKALELNLEQLEHELNVAKQRVVLLRDHSAQSESTMMNLRKENEDMKGLLVQKHRDAVSYVAQVEKEFADIEVELVAVVNDRDRLKTLLDEDKQKYDNYISSLNSKWSGDCARLQGSVEELKQRLCEASDALCTQGGRVTQAQREVKEARDSISRLTSECERANSKVSAYDSRAQEEV